ncbi:MAG TPA: hypothetical protein VHE81_14210 [Lacipirellulaceae bacterium]|nr:hypothetical protein [Lacipirellulaceae bacterium]
MNPSSAPRTPQPAPSIFTTALYFLLVLISFSLPARAAPWKLWQINANGGGLHRFTEASGYTCGSPDWSPDGKFVAYDTWRVGEPLQASQIAVVRADGTHRRLIGRGAMPSWSPDGKQIVCHAYAEAYQSDQLVVMNADGTGRETVANHWGSPRWAPRGNRIASVLNNNIGLFDLTTGTERVILHGPYSVRQGFAISPDGLHFCFGNDTNGIAVASLDERTMTASVRMLAMGGMCHCASWAPDGKRVVAGWQPSGAGFAQLYIFDFAGKAEPKPIAGQDTQRNNYNPDWSPDGKTIVFAAEEANPESNTPNDK